MKKYALAIAIIITLAGCTQSVYSQKGNATIISSKPISAEAVELVVEKDNGEVVTMTREYDAHATVGARVDVAEIYNKQHSDLKTIRRYEFK